MAEDNHQFHPELPHRTSWSPFQNLHRNSHDIASSTAQRIQDLQYYFVHGLSHGFGHGLMNSNPRSAHTNPHYRRFRPLNNITEHFHHHGPPQHDETENEAQHYVINIDPQELDGEIAQEAVEEAESPGDQSEQHQHNHHNNNHSSNNIPDMDVLRNTQEFHIFMSFMERYIPFVILLFLKLLFDHKLGILVISGLFVTFFHANVVVKREVAKQGKRHILRLVWVCINLTTCIAIMYTILADKRLALALIFITPYTTPVDVWEVLWVVSVTDFVIRMITVLLKIFIVAIPAKLVAFHKKGRYYLFVERTSQLYRTIAPMQHWLFFFSESYSGPSKVFGVILSAAYLLFKCKSVINRVRIWKKAFIKVLQSKTYGVIPSANQIKEAGDSCPICQDDFKSPAMLQCKHIFCEDCVALWFDRERTCPVCRAQIADDPSWRDGATSLVVQLF